MLLKLFCGLALCLLSLCAMELARVHGPSLDAPRFQQYDPLLIG